MMKHIISKGGNYYDKNRQGKNPFELAASHGWKEFTDYYTHFIEPAECIVPKKDDSLDNFIARKSAIKIQRAFRKIMALCAYKKTGKKEKEAINI